MIPLFGISFEPLVLVDAVLCLASLPLLIFLTTSLLKENILYYYRTSRFDADTVFVFLIFLAYLSLQIFEGLEALIFYHSHFQHAGFLDQEEYNLKLLAIPMRLFILAIVSWAYHIRFFKRKS